MKTSQLLLALGAIGAAAALSFALNTAEAATAKTASTHTDEQIQQLIAMNGPDRRAYLRTLPVGQRGELYMAMKRMKSGKSSIKGSGPYQSKVNNSAGGEKVASATPAARGAVGTIQYDQGAITDTFGSGAIIGNRFDTHTGLPVVASATVSTVEAVVVQGPAFTTNSAGFVLLGPQTGGGGANAIFSSFTTATGATDTVSFPGIGANYTGASFFVLFGDFASIYVPAFGTGTTLGQGHHGVVGYTGGMGPNITGTFDFGGTLNAFVRASGNVLPVELMNWSVD
jgi:hypothetical protein